MARELGHNLGSNNDGESGLASECLPAENFLMTPQVGLYQTTLTNLQRLSNCSIAQIKATTLAVNLQ